MDTRQAYNLWAEQYDTNKNRTRDLEAVSLRETLHGLAFNRCLEVGCGTGKNTVWLAEHVTEVTAIDLSEEMLQKARQKIKTGFVHFIQADITQDWTFAQGPYDLVTFSLVLEHIEDLQTIFQKVKAVTQAGSYVYIGELHPFKQYTGSKARFDTPAGTQVVPCFTHHFSDFTQAALQNGFSLIMVQEYFDNDDRTTLPRILTLLLKRTEEQ
ncbi:methyltransferase type 11 [Rufibacter radiotolerans]|uniref:Methyltransferase type 11 n=2 Tax=Rufibacter radiotolerans TaxID=1379910 RepID=A0A0H4VLZ0_9BACT|nr:methyltransferase type 11 [Rufibacter radiotolerans]